MKHIIFAIALVGYTQCAKLDHLKYLPPDNRPAKTESFDQGLSAPKSAGSSTDSLSQGSYLSPNPSGSGSASTGPHGSGSPFETHVPSGGSQAAGVSFGPASHGISQPHGSSNAIQPAADYSGGSAKPSGGALASTGPQGSGSPFGIHAPSGGSQTVGGSFGPSSHGISQTQGSPNANQPSASYSGGSLSGYATGSPSSGAGSKSSSFHGSSQPQAGFDTQGTLNANQPVSSYSGGPQPSGPGSSRSSFHGSGYPQFGSGTQGSPNPNQPFQHSGQPQVGFSAQGSPSANQPSVGYAGTQSNGYSSGPQPSGSKSFGASFPQSNQHQTGFGTHGSTNSNQPSAGYSVGPSGGVQVSSSGSPIQPATSGSASVFSQGSKFAQTGPLTSVQPSGFAQSQGNIHGKNGVAHAYSVASQPASGHSGQYKYQSSSQNEIPIIKLDAKNYGDGSYSTVYETGNGIQAIEEGKTQGDTSLVQGAFSYTSPEGEKIGVSYTADENGYHPEGDNIPTPPPIPEAILKSIKYNEAHPDQESDDGSYKGEGSVGSGQYYQNVAPSSSRQYLVPSPGSPATSQFSGKSTSGSTSSNLPVSGSAGTSPASSGYASSSTFSSNGQQPFDKSVSYNSGSQTSTPGQSNQYQSSGPFSGVSGAHGPSGSISGNSPVSGSSATSPVASGYASSSTFSSNGQQPFVKSGSSSFGSQTLTPGQSNQYQSSGPVSGASGAHSFQPSGHSQTPDSSQGNFVNSSLNTGLPSVSSSGQASSSGSFKPTGSQAPSGGAISSTAYSGPQDQTSGQFGSQAHKSVPFSSTAFGSLGPSGSQGYSSGKQTPQTQGPSNAPSGQGGFPLQVGTQPSFGSSSVSSEPKRFQSQGGVPSLQHGTAGISQQPGKFPSLVPGAQGSNSNSAHSGYQYNTPGIPFGASGSQEKGSSFGQEHSEGASGSPEVGKVAGEFGPGFAKNHVNPSKIPGVQAQDENGGYIY